jgi:DNA-binding transcriptional LysR family regulator
MDWRTVQFDWNRARAFLVTAEEGSLSAAARALDTTQPTLGRQVDALERELGVLLFDRVGKRFVLTQSGVDLLEHVRAMGDAASRVSLAASGQSQTLAGPVCITASDVFSVHLLPPMVAKLRAIEPGIDVEIVATNAPRDLRRREADIAIRNFRPEDPELFAKKVRDMTGNLYAATTYLDRIGRPTTKAALSDADFIGFDRSNAMIEVLRTMGLDVTQKNFVAVCENQLVQWELVKLGLGIGVMADVIAQAEPLVEPALPDLAPVVFPVWVVSHRELQTSKRVRMVFDLLVEQFAKV